MARVTVEDCIDKVDNRFELVLLASHRARRSRRARRSPSTATTTRTRSWRCARSPTRRCRRTICKEDLIHSLQKHVEVDEPEADGQELIDQADAAAAAADADDDEDDDHLRPHDARKNCCAGIESLVPPEKSDDY